MAKKSFVERLRGITYSDLKNLSEKSRVWFARSVSRLGVGTNQVLNEFKKVDVFSYGKMYLFHYDPKWKEELEYYDVFPLIIPVQPAPKGFYGLNFHYLHPELRARLLDALRSNRWEDLFLLYRDIKNSPLAKFCFKHYLYSHVKSKFIEIQPVEFDWVMYLPLEKFKKAPKSKVWRDSYARV